MPWGAAIAAGGAIIGGALSAKGSKDAAASQSAADIAAQNTQKQMFNKIVGQEQPFLQAGKGATVGLNALYGTNGKNNQAYGDFGGTGNFSFNPNSILSNPGFRFQMKQGDRALQSSDATTVGALSGAAMKDLSSFNQGLASTYENQYFNQALSTQQQNYNQALQGYQTNQGNYYTNQNNIFNRLSQIASLGQNAAGNLGSQGATLGTGVAQAQAAQGAAQAAGQVGAANAYAGAASTVPLYALLNQSQGGTEDGPPPQLGPPNG